MASGSDVRRRKCVNNPNSFCYICGQYTIKGQKRNITPFIKSLYLAYFNMKLGDQDKNFAPHIVCKTCVENLRQWYKGLLPSMPFGIPMVWREQINHFDDCYFCVCKVSGFNTKNKRHIVYPCLPSAITPVPHGPDIPVPKPPIHLPESVSSSSSSVEDGDDNTFIPDVEDKTPHLYNQSDLNDLVRDLGLTKEKSELLGSRLKERNLLLPGTNSYCFRNREEEFRQFFVHEDELVFCCDIPGLIRRLGTIYQAKDWRLFIDSSKRSLKGVLLHNGNKLASVPVAHSTSLRENYHNLSKVLQKLNYNEHRWLLCCDLKVCSIILGQQGGYTKFPCFLCEWDSRDRDRHWLVSEWPKRKQFVSGEKNIVNRPLIDPQSVLLPPLHIKLGIMKQYVKSLDRSSPCFRYLCQKFPGLSDAKIKEGVFDGPQIRKLMKDPTFSTTMNETQLQAWESFKDVCSKFLGNVKDVNYQQIVETMLYNFQKLGCRMSLKVHFLHSHLDYFPANLGAFSEEHGERFHQDMKEMERRYQGRWDVSMMSDYCWCLVRDNTTEEHKRKSTQRSFTSKCSKQ